MPLLDEPCEVRKGEELPVDSLRAYLARSLPSTADPLKVMQFPCGHSNLTYLLRLGRQELVLRRPPFGPEIKTAHDMSREYRILSSLYPHYCRVPRPLLNCTDCSVIGAPFYLMERVKGIVLRKQCPHGLRLTPETMHRLSTACVDNLAQIHSIDYEALGLGDLGRPKGYVERQVRGWTQRYLKARTDDIPEMEHAARWLAQNLPPESGAALIHNDYKYDNLVLDPDSLDLIAVLDWEMATIGDPLMDLGTMLGYWVEEEDPESMRENMAFCLTTLPGNLRRDEIVERYSRRTGRDISNLKFYYAYGLFKIAIIVQQIYARYRLGFSRDQRFAGLGLTVRLLGQAAARAIEK